MTHRRRSAPNRPQPPISATVRPQPTHQPDGRSIVQTWMQGVRGMGIP